MHAMSGSGDITRMGGLRKRIPWTHAVFFICWLAICGVPLLSGFFSKDAIIVGAFATHAYPEALAWVGPTVGVLLLTAALCTAFYMSRLYFLVFTGPSRADAETQRHIHESPSEMVGPLVVLAVGAALTGYLGFPGAVFGRPELNLLAHWLEPAVGAELHAPHLLEYILMGASIAIAGAGILLAYLFYGGGYRRPAVAFGNSAPPLVRLVRDKFRVDELYGFLIVRPIRMVARGLFLVVDRVLIDKVLVHGAALIVDVSGRLARTVQAGDAQRYVAIFAIGVAAIFWMVTRPHRPDAIKLKIDGTQVEADVGPAGAQPLLYGFDFDGDGEFDRQGRSPNARFVYEGSGTYNMKVVIKDPRWDTVTTLEQKVRIR